MSAIGYLRSAWDDVTVVDDVAVLAAPLWRPAPPQGQKQRGAERALKPIIVKVNIETVPIRREE